MTGFFINFALGGAWMLLGDEPTTAGFARGFFGGFLLLAFAERILPGSRYTRAVLAGLWFGLCFLRELWLANVAMAKAVLLTPVDRLEPDIVLYPVRGLTPFEILVLSHCITLTPGTTTVKVADDLSELTLHVFAAGDHETARASIRQGLEAPLLAATRG